MIRARRPVICGRTGLLIVTEMPSRPYICPPRRTTFCSARARGFILSPRRQKDNDSARERDATRENRASEKPRGNPQASRSFRVFIRVLHHAL